MQEHQRLLRLLNAPDVREPTRAVFRSLLANCEDKKRLCSFVLESITDRVNDRYQSELVHASTCGHPLSHMTNELRTVVESEALNDEARRWMADFFHWETGKGDEKIEAVVGQSKALGARLFPQNLGDTQRRGPYSTTIANYGRVAEVELFPESNDPVRVNRFRVLVDVFHRGYQKAIRDENLASRSNLVLIDSCLVPLFDHGAFHLRFDEEQMYAVPLWDEATAIIPPCAPVNRKSTLRPRSNTWLKKPIGPDRELTSLHAMIMQTWYDTGLSEKLVEDMQWIEGIPSIDQQVSVLGDMFGQILQHRLALL